MKRRSFLKTAAAATASAPLVVGGLKARATTSLSALAQLPPGSDKVLVVIQLFGGNDGLNTLLPVHDPAYYQIRPNLAIPARLAWNGIGDIYLHPALDDGSKGGVATMLQVGNLAIVQNVGYDNPNLSHFRSTDIWLSGINSSDPNVRLDSGWIGRFLEQRYPDFPASLPDDPLAIQFGGFSLALRGTGGRKMGIEVRNPEGQSSIDSSVDQLDPLSAGTPYAAEYEFIADIAQRSNKYAQRVTAAYNSGVGNLVGEYGQDGFGRQMRSVAAMIAGGLNTNVYVVSMGGFDTHFNQQRVDGDSIYGGHPALLARLSDAIAQFQHDMIRLNQADRVIGMTISEFGRRAAENGSNGTDHGAAGVQLVFGTQVNSAIFGEPVDLANLDSNGDVRAQIDYRSVYAEILVDWFRMPLEQVRDVLQVEDLLPVDVLKSPSSVKGSERGYRGVTIASAFPNPFAHETTIEFTLDRPMRVVVEARNVTGGRAATLADRSFEAGRHTVLFGGDLPNGNYLITVRTESGADSRIVQRLR